MTVKRLPSSASRLWSLVKKQHSVLSRTQLLQLGLTSHAIAHRLRTGRVHRVYPGVYAVGRPELSRHGKWMAAVLRCGSEAALSHESAAALWGIREAERGHVEVSVPHSVKRRVPGIKVHRRASLHGEVTTVEQIPVTTPAVTLIDLATRLPRAQLERAINEADKRDLIDPEGLRTALERMRGRRGVAVLRKLLDRSTFTLTDSELERRFIPIALKVGLPRPQTGRRVNGFKVDFYWPDLGLIVETDGLRYHRTPAQQARDRLRDQMHIAAGLTTLRFTHAQVGYEAAHVKTTLERVAKRLRRRV